MWMKRYGWDVICRNGDGDGSGGDGTGSTGTSSGEASQGTGTFGETSGSTGSSGPGTGTGGGGSSGPGPSDVGSVQGAAGAIGIGLGDTTQEEADEESGVTGFDLGFGSGPTSNTVGKAIKTVLPFGVPTPVLDIGAKAIGKGLHDLGVALGLNPQAPPQGENTGSGTTGNVDFGDSGNFGGIGGGQEGAGDGAEQTTAASQRLARSVRSAGRNDTPSPGAARTPAPAPTLDLPSSDINEIRAELDAEREARRRRRRTTRQSTVVTGPLGVPGRPELLQPTAVAGVSRRLLGQ